jgi:hypothetical protein
MPSLLGTLDEIDWTHLRDAYGPAHAVPIRLRELLSNDADTRQFAIEQLGMGICYQGSVSEATAYAVPFLLEILRSAAIQDKDDILMLLGSIAYGSWGFFVFAGVHHERRNAFVARGDMKEEDAEPVFAAMYEWNSAALVAVERGYTVYTALLTADAAKVRLAASYVLTNLALAQRHAMHTTSLALTQFDQEEDDQVQAMIIQGLAQYAPLTAAIINRLLARLDDTTRPRARYAAALWLVHGLRTAVPPRALDVLFEVLDDQESTLALVREQYDTWMGDVTEGIERGKAVSRLTLAVIGPRFPILLRLLQRHPSEWLIPTLTIVFGEERATRDNLTQLSLDQRTTLQTIAAAPAIWNRGDSRELGGQLASFGLPDTPEKLLALLAI